MIRRKEVLAAEALALGTLHRQTQKFEPPSLRDQSFEAETKSGGKGTRRKSQNKMNKSFWLSGGRKTDHFGSGFKPATLPDFQNGKASLVTGFEAVAADGDVGAGASSLVSRFGRESRRRGKRTLEAEDLSTPFL